MTPMVDSEKDVLRQIVRGERPLTDLRALGMAIELGGDSRVLRMSHAITASVDVHDLARGFLAYRHDPDQLKEWAFLIQAADLDIDLSSHPAGEWLQDALWKASFGELHDEEADQVLQQLA